MRLYSEKIGEAFDTAEIVSFIVESYGQDPERISDYDRGYLEGMESVMGAVFETFSEETLERVAILLGVTTADMPELCDFLKEKAVIGLAERLFPQIAERVKEHIEADTAATRSMRETRDEEYEVHERCIKAIEASIMEWKSRHEPGTGATPVVSNDESRIRFEKCTENSEENSESDNFIDYEAEEDEF